MEGKIVVLGAQGVGKTSLVAKHISNIHNSNVQPTIGASFSSCTVHIEDIKVKLQIWDTAGQERFRAMTPMYYRNSNGALLVFDLTNHKSFEDVKNWVMELHKNVPEPMIMSVIGNKADLMENRAVSREEASIYANSINATYFETSAVRDCNIESIFITLAMGICKLNKITPTVSNGFSSQMAAVQLAEDLDSSGLVTGVGIVESASWARETYAHGDAKHLGWCCY